jgi:hypothetical protein
MNKAHTPLSNNDNVVRYSAILLTFIPFFLFRFTAQYLRFRSKVSKGSKIFKHELIKQGIDIKTAQALTNQYFKGTSLRYILKNIW